MERPNLIGRRFGNLTVVELKEVGKQGQVWRCLCTCGRWTSRSTAQLHRKQKAGYCQMCLSCSRERFPVVQFNGRQRNRASNPFKKDNEQHTSGFFIHIYVMDDLIDAFGPIDDGFDNSQIDPSFWERWW